MYLHLGNNILVKTDDVIAIFDLENASIAKSTKRYLALAQKKGWVVNVTMEMPKSFVVCSHGTQGRPRSTSLRYPPPPCGREQGFWKTSATFDFCEIKCCCAKYSCQG